jgi:hypothetical protein
MNHVIPRTFLITGIGRSGTRFLATVLGRSHEYRVTHEWKVRAVYSDRMLKRFPLLRFYLARYPLPAHRRGYGEVNSILRHHLGIEVPGPEQWLERRAIIVRDPREAITSAMNRQGRTDADFARYCETIVRSFARLRDVRQRSPLAYETFWFVDFTRSVEALQRIVDWSGIGDVRIDADTVSKKINTNTTSWFPKFDAWTAPHRELYDRIADSVSLTPADWER